MDSVVNDTDEAVELPGSRTVGAAPSTPLPAAGDLMATTIAVAKEGVTENYPELWTDQAFWDVATPAELPAHSRLDVEASVPVIRFRGAFIVHRANTEWTLNMAEFEVPDPSRAPRVTAHVEPIAP